MASNNPKVEPVGESPKRLLAIEVSLDQVLAASTCWARL